MTSNSIRIGGASGFWGESAMATPQLLAAGDLDYLVYDYLAEITMSIMARARAKDPNRGYATDFVSDALKPSLKTIADRGVKVLSNAGGVNPNACATAVRALIEEAGLDLKVAVVSGDDLLPLAGQLAAQGIREMFSGEDFPDPDTLTSVNAYLGAFPVATALAGGADIVITGRSVDSAVTLGACIHAFGWSESDADELAAGSLAGHILECGPQSTGGNFTDWQLVADDLEHIGYPIAEIAADGTFVCTKPEGTGGLVNVGTVSEQMLYEIGDPQAYILPDVVCDFSRVAITREGDDRVRVSGARGRPAPDTYKVCATCTQGFRGGSLVTFYGLEAHRKARVFADGVFARARARLRRANLPDFHETSVEILGTESQYGSAKRVSSAREVVLKFAARHPEQAGIGILLREATGLGLATPPGLSSFAGTRARPSPVVRLFSFLLPKDQVSVEVAGDGAPVPFAVASGEPFDPGALTRPAPPTPPEDDPRDMTTVPLVQLAWGRSGDKGNRANVGVIARDAAFAPYIWAALTEAAVAERFAHFLEHPGRDRCVERFWLPGSNAINFLLHDVLGGGGVASLRNDPQGKGYAQLLLDHPIALPKHLAKHLAKRLAGRLAG